MKDPDKWSGSTDYQNIIGTKKGRNNHEGISMEGIISIYQAKVSGEDDYAGRLLKIYLRDISGV